MMRFFLFIFIERQSARTDAIVGDGAEIAKLMARCETRLVVPLFIALLGWPYRGVPEIV